MLHLISQGLTNKEGAFRLNIGPRTFESHRARIIRKFRAKNTADLVRMALQSTAAPTDNGNTALPGGRAGPSSGNRPPGL